MSVTLTFVVSFELDNFLDIHVNVLALLVRKGLLSTFKLRWVQYTGELNFEENEEITELVALLVERQTFFLNRLDLIRFYDLTWVVLDTNFLSV